MKVWVQVIMGEEALNTTKKVDSKHPPSWIDTILTFNVPRSLKYFYIKVWDETR